MKFITEISSIDRWRSISIHFVLKRDSYPSYFLSVFGWLVWINSILDPPFLTSSSLDFLGNKHPRQCSTPRTQRERRITIGNCLATNEDTEHLQFVHRPCPPGSAHWSESRRGHMKPRPAPPPQGAGPVKRSHIRSNFTAPWILKFKQARIILNFFSTTKYIILRWAFYM